ncbi:MAG: electron transfer flavoprotein subunit alpha/FixB family protein [Spirochaetales bacterium]|uniref:Electron transfer flavoprotein subunit alpha/FixB family protein n=1 Tax=Candidatus Thalassospirochaeta sargassi TaxID=3119039 RepID=A0AAJ1MHV1_9SPIO|nr:electron transfer flavoprotein subunit alpha/FixB family protein [Spirochaetales bacterium]
MSNRKIFIYAENDCGAIENSYFELLSKAAALNVKLTELEGAPAQLCAVTVGELGEDSLNSLVESGTDVVYSITDESLTVYNPAVYSEAVAQLCKLEEPYIFLFASTAMGTELAPSLGVKLHTGVSAHCVDLRFDDSGAFIQDVPAFGGKVIGEILTPDTLPQIATVKPGIFQCECLAAKSAEVKKFSPSLDSTVLDGIVLKDVHVKDRDSLPVEQAETIICGGFGMGCDENWEVLDRIANYFENSAVGCTRPALDEDWTDDDGTMIGTSGKTVRPKLYIGAGISGAMHHVCGISDAEFIVSINKDENADIFNVSDIKIVGDAVKILTAFEERLVQE